MNGGSLEFNESNQESELNFLYWTGQSKNWLLACLKYR